jgi:hypothetical protein
MKLKGDLESIGVSELFKTLAEQRATGLLSVNSPMGEKTIALAQGEVAVCADNFSERTRLGDLLLARGKVSEEQLAQALKAQKQDPRAKLGDVLIKQGAVTPELISEALRFQVEEQIVDLFTWRDAAFEFDSDRSVDEIEDGSSNGIQRMNVGTQALMADAAKRMENWKQMLARIPTPYLCFKIAPKGEENLGEAPRNTQAIMKLLKEGRTLETTVKKSCLGRFNVYTVVVKLLDDGWIFPIPGNELRFLASEHRFKRRLLDCLYINRRLLETAQNDADRAEYQKQIQDTVEAIESAAAAGESDAGAEIVSFKDAADRFRKRKLRRRIVFGVFCFASLFMIVFLLIKEMAPKAALPDEYQKCIKKSDELLSQRKYDEAVKIWHDFYISIPDKGSQLADFVRHRENGAIEAQRSYFDSLVAEAKNSEKLKKYIEAKKKWEEVLANFTKEDEVKPAKEGINRVDEILKNAQIADTQRTMKERCQAALDIFARKEYTSARSQLKNVLAELPENAECRPAVESALRDIQTIEDQALEALKRARKALDDRNAEEAIKLFQDVYGVWTDVPCANEANKERQRLIVKQNGLQHTLDDAKDKEDFTALQILEGAEKEYPEFKKCAEVRVKIAQLKGKLAEIDKAIAQAQAAMNAGDKKTARALFRDLLKNNNTYLAMKNVCIRVPITSTPDNALVIIDGQDKGRTSNSSANSFEADIPVDRPIQLQLKLDGYEPFEQNIKLGPEKLDGIQNTLKRTAKERRKFTGGIFAPPRIIENELFVFHGDKLAILDREGKQDKLMRDSESLFDPDSEVRPNSNGDGTLIKLNKDDKDDIRWWLPRTPPQPFGEHKVLLSLRSREIQTLDTRTMKTDKLFQLSTESDTRPHIELESYLGFPVVAFGSAEGKIFAYNLKTRELIGAKDGVLADTRPEKKNVRVTALTSRNEHEFISVTNTGFVRCFKTSEFPKEAWSFALETDLGGVANDLPVGKENLAAFVLRNGKVVVYNLDSPKLDTQKKEWELAAAPAREYTHALVTTDGVYVFNRVQQISKYKREGNLGQPDRDWGPHILGGNSELPLIAIPSVGVFIATDAGTVTGRKAKTGDRIFEIDTKTGGPGTASSLGAGGDLLYLGFPTGDLWILSTGDR